ncbi:Hypothetical predicted protein [Pelobates cultripes]|uniref:Uncharacterized protein n=1 Tax=Pelobates cultripes TaxID=61616 RepID=A0AAD1QYM2_PELCU|nr:Hypothetical predicted protein [Pelobates cultripes]
MGETTQPADSQEVPLNPMSSIDRIFQNFWLKLKLRLKQGTPRLLTVCRPPRQPPPNPQHQPATLTGPKTMQQRSKHALACTGRQEGGHSGIQASASNKHPPPHGRPYPGQVAQPSDPNQTRSLTTPQRSSTGPHSRALLSPNTALSEPPAMLRQAGPKMGRPEAASTKRDSHLGDPRRLY